MELGTPAPVDGKRNARAKGDHVVERDAQKSIRAAPMGRAYRYQRRMAHIVVQVGDKKLDGALKEIA